MRFSWLILDLNRASEVVGRTIAELREITSGLAVVFLAFCTRGRKSHQMDRFSDRTFSFRSRLRNAAPGGAVIAALARRPFHPTNRTATAGGWPTCTPRWHVLGRGQQWRNLSNGENRRHTAHPWATWASGRAVMGFADRLVAIAVSRLGVRTAHGIKPSRQKMPVIVCGNVEPMNPSCPNPLDHIINPLQPIAAKRPATIDRPSGKRQGHFQGVRSIDVLAGWESLQLLDQ